MDPVHHVMATTLTARSIFPTKSLGSPSSTLREAEPLVVSAARGLPPMMGREFRNHHARGRRMVRSRMVRSTGDGMVGNGVGLAASRSRRADLVSEKMHKGVGSTAVGTSSDKEIPVIEARSKKGNKKSQAEDG